MTETWRPVAGYEGLYEVSNLGNVRSLYRYKKQLKPVPLKTGYLVVELKGKKFLVHRLVATAFLSNPKEYPQVNHMDENKKNNQASNLEWCSAKYNMNYGESAKSRHKRIDYTKPVYRENAIKNGIASRKPVLQFTKDNVFISWFESGKNASLVTNINPSHIAECCSGKRKSAGGYVWRYEERNDDLSVFQS